MLVAIVKAFVRSISTAWAAYAPSANRLKMYSMGILLRLISTQSKVSRKTYDKLSRDLTWVCRPRASCPDSPKIGGTPYLKVIRDGRNASPLGREAPGDFG